MSYFARHVLRLDFTHRPELGVKKRREIHEFVLGQKVPSTKSWNRELTYGEVADGASIQWPRSRKDLASLSKLPQLRHVVVQLECYGEDADIWMEYALDGETEFQRPTITFPPTNLLPDKDSD